MNTIDAIDRMQLHKALKIFYPNTITNDKLYEITNRDGRKERVVLIRRSGRVRRAPER